MSSHLNTRGAVALSLIAILGFLLRIAQAQSLSLPQFEAASIKRSPQGNLRGSTFESLPGGGLRIVNGTLRAILETAYNFQEFQILGGPSWVNSERYDILARSPDNPGTRAVATDDIRSVRLRLQALLAERFKLEVHRETRELPEYALEVAKNGPKLISEDDASS